MQTDRYRQTDRQTDRQRKAGGTTLEGEVRRTARGGKP